MKRFGAVRNVPFLTICRIESDATIRGNQVKELDISDSDSDQGIYVLCLHSIQCAQTLFPFLLRVLRRRSEMNLMFNAETLSPAQQR